MTERLTPTEFTKQTDESAINSKHPVRHSLAVIGLATAAVGAAWLGVHFDGSSKTSTPDRYVETVEGSAECLPTFVDTEFQDASGQHVKVVALMKVAGNLSVKSVKLESWTDRIDNNKATQPMTAVDSAHVDWLTTFIVPNGPETYSFMPEVTLSDGDVISCPAAQWVAAQPSTSPAL